jgi:hypothetical protein
MSKLGPSDFLYGSLLGEGAFAKVVHVRAREAPRPGASPHQFAAKIMDKLFVKKERKASLEGPVHD